MTPGRFIVFEGIDGCGKSTQSRLLADRLGVEPTREPGGTSLGTSLRALLLDGDHVEPRAEALLMAADRAQHVGTVIEPALASGQWVVCDRYVASTFAYQGFGRGLDLGDLELLVAWATAGLVPDLTVLIDLDPAEAARRRGGQEPDRFEAAGLEFSTRVAEGYRHLAERAPDAWLVVDGLHTPAEIASEVLSALEERWSGDLPRS